MIDHDAVITRVGTAGIFQVVGGAAEASTAIEGKLPLGDGPNAYVVPIADQVSPPQQLEVLQVETVTFGVLLMVRAAGDASGKLGLKKIKTIQSQLRASLLGWSPGAGFDPIWGAGGRIVDFSPGVLWWLEEFQTRCPIIPSF